MILRTCIVFDLASSQVGPQHLRHVARVGHLERRSPAEAPVPDHEAGVGRRAHTALREAEADGLDLKLLPTRLQ